MTDGFGSITWWGFTPALDLQQEGVSEQLKKLKISEDPEELHILLIGAGDIRHILTTVSRLWRHPKIKLHFYIIEASLELYARDILLLNIALEPQSRMGLQEKTELFLEVFGNTFIRQQACEYVEKISTEFIKMVTDLSYLEKRLPLIDLSQLKFKERDFMEGIFKFWRNSNSNKSLFDVSKCWDLRERQRLGIRYDSKKNVYDWDYHMKLADAGADIIHKIEYSNWRDSGIAFTIREGTYDIPNRTLASGMVFNQGGERHARRGYWGDMVVSPFIPFGIESEEKSFFKKNNELYTKTSENVSEYNINALFHELMKGEKYILPNIEVKTETPKLQEITEEDEEEAEEEVTSSTETSQEDNKYEYIQIDDVKITFLPLNSVEDIKKKSKYKNLFNMVYFSNSMVHHLKPDLTATLSDKCTLLLETARFMLELKSEQLEEFVCKISGLAESAGCKVLNPGTGNGKKENYVTCLYERS